MYDKEITGVFALVVIIAIASWGVHDRYFTRMQAAPAGAVDVSATGLSNDAVAQSECGRERLSHIEWREVFDPAAESPFNPAGFMANRGYDLGTVYCGGRIVTLRLRTDERSNARRIVALGSEEAWLRTVCPHSRPPYYQEERIEADDSGNDVAMVTCYSGFHAVERRLVE